MANNFFKNIKDSVGDVASNAVEGTTTFVMDKKTEQYQKNKTKTIEGLKSTYSLSDAYDPFLDELFEGIFNCEETFIDKDQVLKAFYPEVSRRNRISKLSEDDYLSLLRQYKLDYMKDSFLLSSNLLSLIKLIKTLMVILKLEHMDDKYKSVYMRNMILLIGALYQIELCVPLVRLLNFNHIYPSEMLVGKKMDDVISGILENVLDKENNEIQSQSCLDNIDDFIDAFSFSYESLTCDDYLNDIDAINTYFDTNNHQMVVQSSTYELEGVSLPLQIVNKGQYALSKIVDSDIAHALAEYAPNATQLASAGKLIMNASNSDLYKVIIPKGAQLAKSAKTTGAFRGIVLNSAGKISNQAELVKTGAMGVASGPLMLANLANAAQMQQEFKKLNVKIDKMNKTVDDVKSYLDNTQKGKITSMVKQISDTKNHLGEILNSENLRKNTLHKLEDWQSDTSDLLDKLALDIEGITNKKYFKDVNEYQECVEKLENCVFSQEMLLETINQLSELSYVLYQEEKSEDFCFSGYNRNIEKRNQLSKEIYLWHIQVVDQLGIDTLSGKVDKFGVDKLLRKNAVDEKLLTIIKSQVQKYPKIVQGLDREKAIYLDGQGNYYILDEN